MKSFWLLPLSLSLVAAAVPITACSSNKNHEERANTPEADAAVDPSFPELVKDPTAQQAARKAACLSTCLPDPGSRAVDCGEELAGYEYAWAWDLGSGKAIATYSYDDSTTNFLVPTHNGWEPQPDPIDLCGMTGAIRFRGGPFTEYGGGFGISFVTVSNARANLPQLDPSPQFEGDGIDGAYDLSAWEGVAIWVRRGPNGQSSLRVGVTERNSSEDLNTSTYDGATMQMVNPEKEGRYCKRYRLCGCPAGTPCTISNLKNPLSRTVCWNPELSGSETAPIDAQPCGEDRCDDPNTSTGVPDALFAGRACEVAMTSDGLSNSYCFNRGTDPNPPAKRERCGNPFSRPVNVGLDWQLIRVPFSDLRQADEAAVAEEMDLASVKQLVFTHTTGWIDFWVANIGFYRRPTQ